jgi:hypothetical protein
MPAQHLLVDYAEKVTEPLTVCTIQEVLLLNARATVAAAAGMFSAIFNSQPAPNSSAAFYTFTTTTVAWVLN